MNRFKILSLFLLVILTTKSDSGIDPLKTIVGGSLLGYGFYNLLSDREKRKHQIRNLETQVDVGSLAEMMQSSVVSNNADRLKSSYEELRRNFHIFEKGLEQNVDTVKDSVETFIRDSNRKIRALKEQLKNGASKGSRRRARRLRGQNRKLALNHSMEAANGVVDRESIKRRIKQLNEIKRQFRKLFLQPPANQSLGKQII